MFKPQEYQIPRVFFTAMRDRYAKGIKKGTIIDLPRSKTIPFELGDFRVVDCYFTSPDSEYSFGQTIIWHKEVPVWTMSYQGWYLKSAISFLKRVLFKAYTDEKFFGGRGPRFYREGGMTYINNIKPPNDWRHFHGHEKIFDRNGNNLGWHEYQGLLLPSK